MSFTLYRIRSAAMALNHRLVLQTIVAYASFIAGHHFAATEINAPAQPTLKCERGQGECIYDIYRVVQKNSCMFESSRPLSAH